MAKSKWLSELQKSNKSAVALYDYRHQLNGAVGSSEIADIVIGALMTANAYIKTAKSLIDECDLAGDETIAKQISLVDSSTRALKLSESTELPEVDFVDPYEAEYVPAELLGTAKAITESINEDDDLPDELDDDPDAVMTLDPEGLPTQYDNTPLELDPFAVRMFRNNGELIDPPEVFDVVKNANDTTEPEIDPGVAQPAEVDTAAADDFIDVVADAQPEEVPEVDPNTVVVDTPPAEKDTAVVELPVDDFDVFANESHAISNDFDVFSPVNTGISRVTPKASSNVLPPQFESVERREQDLDNIAVDPGKNLKFLSYLFNSSDDGGLF